eukprot:TRINITY_DN4745_c0_g4_i2.p1 TRINITY_DN4745_c0_g4~~TRINITY_DN4745_c0_g4_i2.p1  ORF type:complete len:247 (+),score=36.72 TRINITY_DN4745_c0_g4_i2:31-771(+)
MSEPSTGTTVIDLNVGGVCYTTEISTLRRHETSVLAQMFEEPFAVSKDAAGRWFLDRDGKVFAYVLSYLRDGKIQGIAPEDVTLLSQVSEELAYFGLPHVLPLEELLSRDSALGYSAEKNPSVRKKKDQPTYTHIRISQQNLHPSIHLPSSASSLLKPRTTNLDDILQHYGDLGYELKGFFNNDTYIMTRETTYDKAGYVPHMVHPSSDTQRYMGGGGMPPNVAACLNKVRSINQSLASPPPTPNY